MVRAYKIPMASGSVLATFLAVLALPKSVACLAPLYGFPSGKGLYPIQTSAVPSRFSPIPAPASVLRLGYQESTPLSAVDADITGSTIACEFAFESPVGLHLGSLHIDLAIPSGHHSCASSHLLAANVSFDLAADLVPQKPQRGFGFDLER